MTDFNLKGTLYNSFRIGGTSGIALYQGTSLPTLSLGTAGDLYFYHNGVTGNIYINQGTAWNNPALNVPSSGVTAGTYGNGSNIPQFVVNSQGLLTFAGNIPFAGGGGGTGTVTNIVAGTDLTGGTITNTGTLNLSTTGVTAGTYGNSTSYPTVTVDTKGRITNIGTQTVSSTGGTGTITNIVAGTGLTGGTITNTGTLAIDRTLVTTYTTPSGGTSGMIPFTSDASGSNLTYSYSNNAAPFPLTFNASSGLLSNINGIVQANLFEVLNGVGNYGIKISGNNIIGSCNLNANSLVFTGAEDTGDNCSVVTSQNFNIGPIIIGSGYPTLGNAAGKMTLSGMSGFVIGGTDNYEHTYFKNGNGQSVLDLHGILVQSGTNYNGTDGVQVSITPGNGTLAPNIGVSGAISSNSTAGTSSTTNSDLTVSALGTGSVSIANLKVQGQPFGTTAFGAGTFAIGTNFIVLNAFGQVINII